MCKTVVRPGWFRGCGGFGVRLDCSPSGLRGSFVGGHRLFFAACSSAFRRTHHSSWLSSSPCTVDALQAPGAALIAARVVGGPASPDPKFFFGFGLIVGALVFAACEAVAGKPVGRLPPV